MRSVPSILGVVGVAALGAAIPSVVAAEEGEKTQVPVSDRVSRVIDRLESEASIEEIARLTDLFRRAEVAIYKERGEERAIVMLGAASASDIKREDDLDALLEQINAHYPLEVDRMFFRTLYGWTSVEELAVQWGIEFPKPIKDLTEREIQTLLDAMDRSATTGKIDRFVWYLENSVGAAYNTDLTFYSYREWKDGELASEIVTRRNLLEEGGEDALDAYELEVAREVWADFEAKPWALQWASGKLYPDDRSLRGRMLREREQLAEGQVHSSEQD